MRQLTLSTAILLAMTTAAIAQEQPAQAPAAEEAPAAATTAAPPAPPAPPAPAIAEPVPQVPAPVAPTAPAVPAAPTATAPAAVPAPVEAPATVPAAAAPEAAPTSEPATQLLDQQIESKKEEVKPEAPKEEVKKEEVKEEVKKEEPKKEAKPKKKAAKKAKTEKRKHFGETTAKESAPGSDVFTNTLPTPAVAPRVLPQARTGELIDSAGAYAIPTDPLPVLEANGIKYVTGGIGQEEETQLKSVANEFNVQVLLTASQGEYLGDAMVRVLDANNAEKLIVDEAGPYFYTQLAPGKYTLEVTAKQGGIKTLPITVPASGTVRQQMRFTE